MAGVFEGARVGLGDLLVIDGSAAKGVFARGQAGQFDGPVNF